jgi:hypothetical protein
MTDKKMGQCEECGHVAEVVWSAGNNDYAFGTDRYPHGRSWHCPECTYFHDSGVPLMEEDEQEKGINYDPPPRISLDERVFYAVRSKRTGALFPTLFPIGDLKPIWYDEEGFCVGVLNALNAPSHINLCMFDAEDYAREKSELARDEAGNPEPVEIVKYRLSAGV